MNVQVSQTNEFQITTENGVENQCKLIWLDNSHFDELYDLEKKAAEELAGNYILKSKTFVQGCLDGGFCCGVVSEGKLMAFLMLDLLQGSNHGYGDILGYRYKENEKFLFRDGAYVASLFRRRGVAKKMGQFLTTHPKFKAIHSIYSAISPINYSNLTNFTKSGYVLRRFYHTISGGGRLRYLIQYWPNNKSFEEGSTQKILSENHERQRELFAQNYVGVKFIFEEGNIFILFKKPINSDWYKQHQT